MPKKPAADILPKYIDRAALAFALNELMHAQGLNAAKIADRVNLGYEPSRNVHIIERVLNAGPEISRTNLIKISTALDLPLISSPTPTVAPQGKFTDRKRENPPIGLGGPDSSDS